VGEALAHAGLAEVTLVDYVDGYMARHRQVGLTQLAAYRDEEDLRIPEDAVAIFQSMTPWSIFPRLRPEAGTRLLFWNCHPFNLVPTLPGMRTAMQRRPLLAKLALGTILRPYAARMRRFVRLLLARGSLVFMDRPNLETTEELLGLEIEDPQYLPIPAPEVPAREVLAIGGALRVAWVGRVVDFKYFILAHALRQLDAAQAMIGMPVEVTIVGSGDYHARLVTEAAALTRIDIRFIGEMSPDAVDAMLRERTDLLLAMGTAAIEGAKLAVPTLLLDIAYGSVDADYRFSWLHEREGLTLGDMASRRSRPDGRGSMTARLHELLGDPQAVAAADLAHFRRFHALSVVATGLSTKAASALCRWGELEAAGLTRRGLVYTLFARLRKRFGKR
jgi:hypothetical protein